MATGAGMALRNMAKAAVAHHRRNGAISAKAAWRRKRSAYAKAARNIAAAALMAIG